MALVASTLLDLVKNLRAFAGILMVGDVFQKAAGIDFSSLSFIAVCCVHVPSLQVVYYMFAVFGIWLFEGAIKPPEQIRYRLVCSY